MSNNFFLLTMTLSPFIGALSMVFLPKHARNATVAISWLVAFMGIFCAFKLYPSVASGVVRCNIEWLSAYGLNFVFRIDGLAWVFSLLVLMIGALVILYARYYMSPQDSMRRFFAFFLAFMGSMLGIVISGNLIQLVIFWELTSIFSFLLVGYWHYNANARDGAFMALTVTGTGGLCLFVGVILLGQIAGSFDLDTVLASGEIIRQHSLYLPMLCFIIIGVLTKSAQFPFSFWLPYAMAAPTPVSAYLHSATMVKAGIFLLIRLWPVLSGTDAWLYLVGGAGLISLLLGAYTAIFQHDLKGFLAYSTISHLGLITLLLGLGSPLAMVAAIFHTLNHATFKASLFMAAGIIDHEAGTRDMRQLSGLFKFMPYTATLAMVAAAAMGGVPLLNGFLSKEMFLSEVIHIKLVGWANYALPVLATLASIFAVLYSLRFIHTTFFGPPPVNLSQQPHEPPRWMRFPIEMLVLICLIVGIFPQSTIGPFLYMAVQSVLGIHTPNYSLAIWHGLNPAMIMSFVALLGGSTLYILFREKINHNVIGPPLIHRLRGGRMYEITITAATLSARWLKRKLSTRRLQPQMRIIALVTLVVGGIISFSYGWQISANVSALEPAFALLWLAGGSCAMGAAYLARYHRLSALILAGGAGLACCLTFVLFSAPDLAVTQLLVEIVTTVLLLLGLRWLPTPQQVTLPLQHSFRVFSRRAFDLIIAIAAGTGIAALSYSVMTRPLENSISSFFLEHAYEAAGGRNVVNVLLVDFRGFDTLGEITVLGIVGLTVFALLRRFRPAADSLGKTKQQKNAQHDMISNKERSTGNVAKDYMMVPRLVIQWLFPVIIVFTLHLFLRGHDWPGGGFAAGMALAIAFLLQYIAFGVRWLEMRLNIFPLYCVGVGLLLAVLTGIGALFFGYPFLSSYFRYAELPIIGAIPLASAIIFDLGVFVLVLGSTTLILIALAHQSIRKPREAIENAIGTDTVDASSTVTRDKGE